MGYDKAMELAGAKVLKQKWFGDYQGTWWAHVEFNGRKGWVSGSFGSCTVCDAFQNEFSNNSHECKGDRVYPSEFLFQDGCFECENNKNRLIEFGLSYLNNMMTQAEAEKLASKNVDWDMEADEVAEFIKEEGNFYAINKEAEKMDKRMQVIEGMADKISSDGWKEILEILERERKKVFQLGGHDTDIEVGQVRILVSDKVLDQNCGCITITKQEIVDLLDLM